MNNIGAALIFFTRLPFWRIFNVPNEYFKQVINYWSVVGWLTGSIMALVLWATSFVFPIHIAVVLAILSRLLITGALHEDGLADFFDGFGGGTSKERILAIMKDSHIGTYGVISLIFYFLLLFFLLTSLPLHIACLVVLAGDPLCKFIGSLITLRLPYARNEETSKAKMVYKTMVLRTFILSALFGLVPFFGLLPKEYWLAVILPILAFLLLTSLMNKKIQGYTGDCCGALFLMCELSFYLGIVAVYNLLSTLF
ncbi:adenosylcobinamide-GDP ribazoletransferase [Dysgonomonas sp. GY617]|uniref:adenosylcobinamide-GDP ribazoletransferase n=1 Tax=Dysgonomonas sp. GY617 TaxID=2780420 RepID=UPI001883F255|nr:adenosylcobinamide-GDP ribazoletransferase [Dysgonomonas sp. GY617]MBF0574501.1 adenosylcobinamide-GDP ribazoletransferase [Dysgonomonas sp. GY617]